MAMPVLFGVVLHLYSFGRANVDQLESLLVERVVRDIHNDRCVLRTHD